MKILPSSLFILTLVLSSCVTQSSSISVNCERGNKGNYILKWEIYPEVDNKQLEIFSSLNDEQFPQYPLMTTNSNDFIVVVDTKDSTGREFFKIKLDGIYSGIVSNRFFNMQKIQNFRDLGGYYNNSQKQIKWGKIYRSGSLNQMSDSDQAKLTPLAIKTVINLCPKIYTGEITKLKGADYIEMPMAIGNYITVKQQILEGRFFRGDAVIYTQDTYKDLVDNYADKYAEFFDYLCNKDNYPIVFNCFLGKEQVALASYYLLYALDIPEETIEEDYMASNIGVNKKILISDMGDIDEVSESGQEALTMLAQTDISFLKFALSCMRKKSGSVDEYITKEIKLTPEKRKKLREILLY